MDRVQYIDLNNYYINKYEVYQIIILHAPEKVTTRKFLNVIEFINDVTV
jgi:hypothetical protein